MYRFNIKNTFKNCNVEWTNILFKLNFVFKTSILEDTE